jgi:hypothetical protein
MLITICQCFAAAHNCSTCCSCCCLLHLLLLAVLLLLLLLLQACLCLCLLPLLLCAAFSMLPAGLSCLCVTLQTLSILQDAARRTQHRPPFSTQASRVV